jgi:hypothetical protein
VFKEAMTIAGFFLASNKCAQFKRREAFAQAGSYVRARSCEIGRALLIADWLTPRA